MGSIQGVGEQAAVTEFLRARTQEAKGRSEADCGAEHVSLDLTIFYSPCLILLTVDRDFTSLA